MRNLAALFFGLAPLLAMAQISDQQVAEARALLETNQHVAALSVCNTILAEKSNHPDALYLRASVKFKLLDANGALADLNAALAAAPRHVQAYMLRAQVKTSYHDYPGALQDYRSASELDPALSQATEGIDDIRFRINTYEEAIGDFTQMIEQNPADADAYYLRGLLYLSFGQMQDGCRDLSRAGELGDMESYDAIRENCNVACLAGF